MSRIRLGTGSVMVRGLQAMRQDGSKVLREPWEMLPGLCGTKAIEPFGASQNPWVSRKMRSGATKGTMNLRNLKSLRTTFRLRRDPHRSQAPVLGPCRSHERATKAAI